jgi:2-C-methyl-D-erythritol 4-phosphate cytidylyltransferase/2-C-methyl-D-erythritol 2,4-cyclodiphosphate synthase
VGAAHPKQLLSIGGRTMLERSVALFVAHRGVTDIVVALPSELAAAPPPYLRGASKPLRVVEGGRRRQDSVANAFALVPSSAEIVVVHDAARPFASQDLISRTVAAAAEAGAALAAVAARDTVKRAGAGGWVAETLPREAIVLAQTPQAFRRSVLAEALALAAGDATDEASLAERAGHAVKIVAGEHTNIKVTVPDDLPMAEAIASRGAPALVRMGVGYDLHRLVEGRPLILGGVRIPFERGLLGHSDADAVCHAIAEAVFGAAAAGDLGRHFPPSDARWKDASSVDLLRRSAEIVAAMGLRVANVDASVVAERPVLAPYVDAMRANVAAALGLPVGSVSIKGKTNEGVGALGRGEAIAVHAVASVVGSTPDLVIPQSS